MNQSVDVQQANNFNEAQSILSTLSKENLNHFKRDFGYDNKAIEAILSSAAEVDKGFTLNLMHFMNFVKSPDNGINELQSDFLDMMGTNEYDATAAAYRVVDWDNKI